MDTEVIDQPVEEIVDQPQDDQPADDSGDTGEQQPTEKIDGRKFNPEWSKHLKELRELYPDKADMLTKLRDTYGRYGALTEIAPKGLDDVRGWKTTIDAIGGPEAAAQLMQRASEIEEIDNRIANADFSVVNELPEEMQKGFYGMLPDALAHVAQTDEKRFAEIVLPHFQSALEATGIKDLLSASYEKTDDPAARAAISEIWNWYQRAMKGSGQQQPGARAANPEVERLRAELNQTKQAEQDKFADGIGEHSKNYVKEAFAREMSAYKGLGLNEKQTSDLYDSVEFRVANELSNDGPFMRQLDAFKALKTKDAEQIKKFISAHIDSRAKSALDDIVSTRYAGMKSKPQPRVADNTQTTTGIIRVNKAPEQSEWDLDKMNDLGYDQTAKKGIYHLKGNKIVQLVRA